MIAELSVLGANLSAGEIVAGLVILRIAFLLPKWWRTVSIYTDETSREYVIKTLQEDVQILRTKVEALKQEVESERRERTTAREELAAAKGRIEEMSKYTAAPAFERLEKMLETAFNGLRERDEQLIEMLQSTNITMTQLIDKMNVSASGDSQEAPSHV